MSRETFINEDKTILNTDFYLYLLKQENILTEFEKWLDNKINFYKNNFQGYSYERYKEILDKLQELKEVRNNGSSRYL